MHTRLKFLGIASAVLLAMPIMSCSDGPLSPNAPRLSPGQGSHAAIPLGTFTWLPPLGTGSANPATFDPTAANRVEICIWVSNACSGAPVATFTTSPTPGAGPFVVNTAAGQYEANWNLLSTSLAIRRTYRIRALQGTTELGGILVDVVRGRWALTPSGGPPPPLVAANELPIRFHVAVVPLAQVKINEIESNGGTPGDWVELYNPTASPIDLSNFEFRDNDNTHHFFFAPGKSIAPGEHLVLDGDSPDADKFSFGLGSGDQARLFDQYGRLVDSYTWTAHAATTYGRCPDGTGGFVENTTSTRGAVNDCSNPVKINEVESSDPTPGPDWIELYNPSAIKVDLSGYKLKDNDGNSFTIPAGTTINAGAFLAFTSGAGGSFTFGLGQPDGATLASPSDAVIDTYSWTTHATATTYGRCPDGSGAFVITTSPTKGAANDCAAAVAVKINEVESSDPSGAADWIELFNAGPSSVNLGGYQLKDNDGNSFSIPAGTMIGSGAFLVFTQNAANSFTFGLGSADGVTLATPSNVTVDTYSWTLHSPMTYGRCPDPKGTATTPFITDVSATKGSANACPTSWPGGNTITTVDVLNAFSGGNLSGLMFEAGVEGGPDVLWAVRNNPEAMYRLIMSGGNWVPDPDGGWASGKLLRYTNGLGRPDAEDLTFTTGSSAAMYVATERDNGVGTTRPSILRFDVTSPAAELTATHEWNLASDLPVLGPNLGLEGIMWVPDSYLVSKAFFDDAAGHLYTPADYADHAGGLFFVAVEQNAVIYVYALNHTTSTFTRITSFYTGFPAPGSVALQLDREQGSIWAICDDVCGGLSNILEIDTTPGSPTLGHLVLTHIFTRPSGMPNINNEGFAITPLSFCSGGVRPAYWADDGNTAGHSIRQGSVPCAPLSGGGSVARKIR